MNLLKIGYRYPWQVVWLLVVISVLALLSIPNLRLEITAEGMMVKDDPLRHFYERALETFGSDNVTIIYLEDEKLFDREKLLAIQKVVKQLDSTALIDHTVSLFSVRNVRTKDGYTYTDPYLNPIPETASEIASVKMAALHNPLVEKNLLSDDGTAMAINVFLDTSDYHRGFDEKANMAIKEIIQPLHDQLENVFFLGDPYVRAGLTERIKQDQSTIIPVSIFLLVLTLALTLRQWHAALIPLLTAGLSILWTLAIMAALDISVNVMTSIIPALLIIIGSTEDIHLLTEYRNEKSDNSSGSVAFNKVAKNMWLAILLTFMTTYIGFLSVSMGHLELLQQFGLIASTGLALNFMITILVIPVILKFINFPIAQKNSDKGRAFFQTIALKIYFVSTKHRAQVVAAIIVVSLIAIYFANQVHLNNNVMDYFDDDSELVLNADKLHQKLSGIQTFSIILTGTEDTFLQVPYLQELWDLQDFLKDTGNFDSSYSFADFIGVIHSGLDSEWNDLIYLPDRNAVVHEYMTLLDQQSARTFVSEDFSQARVFVRHNIGSSEELNNAVAAIEGYVQLWVDPSIKVNITGENYLNSRAVDYMAEGQFYSLILMLSAIFLIVSFLFMNLKAGLIAVISNLFPIIILFGIMGLFTIPVNTGTAMVAAISLGVCVDYTMHFMVRYQRLSRQACKSSNPLFETVKEESVPIMSTALALSAGFFALSLSDFPPVARFGQLSALVMLLALISTFVLTVIMLQHTRLITVWDVLSMKLKSYVLETCPLFQGMYKWQAKKIIAMSKAKDFVRDEVIVMQGQQVNSLFVLLDGKVEHWRTRGDGSTYKVSVTQPGGVFGVLLDDSGQPCFADIIAVEPVSLMVLNWHDLHHISKAYPRLATRLYKNLSIVIASMLKNIEMVTANYYDESSGAMSAPVFHDFLNSMVLRANRYDEELTVFCIHLENKSEIYGQSLINQNQAMGSIVQEQMRSPDSFGRWDAKNLCIACPNTSHDQIRKLVERVKMKIENEEKFAETKAIFSYNVSSLEIGESVDHFLHRISCDSDKGIPLSDTSPVNFEKQIAH